MVNVDKDLIRDIHEYFKQINRMEILKPLINEFTGETVGHKLDKIDVDGYIIDLNHILKKEENDCCGVDDLKCKADNIFISYQGLDSKEQKKFIDLLFEDTKMKIINEFNKYTEDDCTEEIKLLLEGMGFFDMVLR